MATAGSLLDECNECNVANQVELFSEGLISIMHAIVNIFHTLCVYEHACVCLRMGMHVQMYECVCTYMHAYA